MEFKNLVMQKERIIAQLRKDELKYKEEIKVGIANLALVNEEKATMNTKLDYYYKTNSNLMADFNVQNNTIKKL